MYYLNMFKKRAGVGITLLMVSVLLALAPMVPVSAQEPTPSPTPLAPSPTPNYQQAVALTSGNSLLIVNTITTGDIAVVLSVLGLLLVVMLRGFVEIPRIWQQR